MIDSAMVAIYFPIMADNPTRESYWGYEIEFRSNTSGGVRWTIEDAGTSGDAPTLERARLAAQSAIRIIHAGR